MSEKYIYTAGLIIFGISLIITAYWIITISQKNIKIREKLPRNSVWGIVLAIIDIIWCVYHSDPLLPVWFKPYIIPTAIFAIFIGYMFLDYLFSRTFGGLLILLCYYFLHESFTYHTPLAALFAVCCYSVGIAGLFICGKPYLLRDFIRSVEAKPEVRKTAVGFSLLFGIFSLCLGIFHFVANT